MYRNNTLNLRGCWWLSRLWGGGAGGSVGCGEGVLVAQ